MELGKLSLFKILGARMSYLSERQKVLSENIAYDPETGQLLSGSFMDYGMPRGETMCRIETYDNPVPTNVNPLGVKGSGQAGAIAAPQTVMAAVRDALASVGVTEIDMPATPERVWLALQQAGSTR